jgi:hypothetical protein
MLRMYSSLETDVDASMSLFEEACGITEEEKKALLFEDVFNKAIIFALKNNKYVLSSHHITFNYLDDVIIVVGAIIDWITH